MDHDNTSFFEKIFEFSIYLDAIVSLCTDIIQTVFYWNGNHVCNYALILIINFYFLQLYAYAAAVLVLYVLFAMNTTISFDRRLENAAAMQSFWKGSQLRVVWTLFCLFSENGSAPLTSTIFAAIGGPEVIGNIEPQLSFLRQKKHEFTLFVIEFTVLAKKLRDKCNSIDKFILNPWMYLFDMRLWTAALTLSSINSFFLVIFFINAILLWHSPFLNIARGLNVLFLRMYYKRYFSIVLANRRVIEPICLVPSTGKAYFVRIPSEDELLQKKILFFDVYKDASHELVRVLYLYENERWWPGIGWTDSLRSTDRPRFSSEDGSFGCHSLTTIEKQARLVAPEWSWLDLKWSISPIGKFNISQRKIPAELVFGSTPHADEKTDFWEYATSSKAPFQPAAPHSKDIYKLRRRLLFKRLVVDFAHYKFDF